MRAGRLRYRVYLQRPVETRNAYGEAVPTWYTYHECWASVVPVNASESKQGRQVYEGATHEIRLRWQDTEPMLTSKHRLLSYDGTRTWYIVGMMNRDERNREWVLSAREEL